MINLAAFFIRHWRLVLPALTALLMAGAYYGGKFTGYQAGKAEAAIACAEDKAEAAEAAVKAANKSASNLERNMRNAKSKTDIATDASLVGLGIMRAPEDR